MLTKKILAVVASAVLVAGCSATDSTGTPQPVTVDPGSYMMVTVNGASLPTNVADGQSPVLVNSGSLTLDASGKYTIEVSYQRLIGETWTAMTDTCAGSYTRTPHRIEFQEMGACTGNYSGSVQNHLLTVWLGPNLKVEYRM